MAEGGSWQSIQRIGLRTTRQLVDECDPGPAMRQEILGQRRRRSYTLTHHVVGGVTIRDQGPLGLHNLRPALTDMTVEQWLDALNDRVLSGRTRSASRSCSGLVCTATAFMTSSSSTPPGLWTRTKTGFV